MRNAIAGAAVVLAAGGTVAACGSSGPAPITSRGTITVRYDTAQGETDPYDSSSQVVVSGPDGKVLGTANLTADGYSSTNGFNDTETWAWTVTVPGGESRYGITVNGSSGQHGTVWESPGEMKAGPALTLDLTTGGGL